MNDIEKYKAKKQLKAELKKANWQLQLFNDGTEFDLMLYCYDALDTKKMVLAGLCSKDITYLSSKNYPIEVLASSVNSAFESYNTAKNSKAEQKNANFLSVLSSMYALNTETFKKLLNTTNPEQKTKHLIVMLYRNKHTSECNLRPYSLLNGNKVLTLSEVKQASQPIISRDKNLNPHFFDLSPVIKMR